MKKIKMMRKAFAVVSAMALTMGMASAVFAEEKIMASKPATYNAVMKDYVIQGTGNTSLYPVETLRFISTPDSSNPSTANLEIGALTVAGNQDQALTVNVPSYTEVGTYHYTLSEVAGSGQGVTYTSDTIGVSVLVTYDYEDADKDGYCMTAEVGITMNNGKKNDTFSNNYDVGSLAISKEVTGNMGDRNKYFDVTVAFTAETGKTVESAITVSGGSSNDNPTTVAGNWTGTKTVNIKLKDGDTLTFTDIPAGVTYEVTESDVYSKDTNKNGENGYDAPKYTLSDSTKKVASADTDTVKITNHKNTQIDTGVYMDNLPYIAALAVILCFAAVLLMRRRHTNG